MGLKTTIPDLRSAREDRCPEAVALDQHAHPNPIPVQSESVERRCDLDTHWRRL